MIDWQAREAEQEIEVIYNWDMDLIIDLTGLAREIVGVKEIPLAIADPASYADIIRHLGKQFPALKGVIITPDGESLLSSVMLIRNGVDLVLPDNMGDTPVNGDRLALIFVIVGGILNG